VPETRIASSVSTGNFKLRHYQGPGAARLDSYLRQMDFTESLGAKLIRNCWSPSSVAAMTTGEQHKGSTLTLAFPTEGYRASD
jgi:hypothetical protein